MSDQQPTETIEDVRQACIDLAYMADRLGGTWDLSVGHPEGQTVYTVKVFIPVDPPQSQQRQPLLDLTGTGGEAWAH